MQKTAHTFLLNYFNSRPREGANFASPVISSVFNISIPAPARGRTSVPARWIRSG